MHNISHHTICRDIIPGSPDVKWESIKGLENVKRLLEEAVVMPITHPNIWWSLLAFAPKVWTRHPLILRIPMSDLKTRSFSCIPLYNFSYIYDYIVSTSTSFIDSDNVADGESEVRAEEKDAYGWLGEIEMPENS
ncbi:hypothetical protein QN277_016605 [Acacia crassicarpa]|uniref:Uncharacterized protein n=1 Tax=Acacia crassicarpa TaxID=499986 RepID=A0AAE1TB18_9FABA|nr:hypothetical protein QN277_016605 [Acacia crassicarpa]